MKKINVSKIKKELAEYDIAQSSRDLILNNVLLLNGLIDAYDVSQPQKGTYMIYQLNVQIYKQMLELKKIRLKEPEKQVDDAFTLMLKDIEKNKKEKRG